jgi:hypothetical protein
MKPINRKYENYFFHTITNTGFVYENSWLFFRITGLQHHTKTERLGYYAFPIDFNILKPKSTTITEVNHCDTLSHIFIIHIHKI